YDTDGPSLRSLFEHGLHEVSTLADRACVSVKAGSSHNKEMLHALSYQVLPRNFGGPINVQRCRTIEFLVGRALITAEHVVGAEMHEYGTVCLARTGQVQCPDRVNFESPAR